MPPFASMSACAAITGIPMQALREAKAAGCDGFSIQGRVDLRKFLIWHFSKPANAPAEQAPASGAPVASLDWGERKKRADALYQEQKLMERQLQSVPLSVIEARDARVGIKARLLLERLLTVDAPPRIADRPLDAIRPVMEEITDEVCAAMSEGLSPKALAAEMRKTADKEDDEDGPGDS